jgi:hypothetical protein
VLVVAIIVAEQVVLVAAEMAHQPQAQLVTQEQQILAAAVAAAIVLETAEMADRA